MHSLFIILFAVVFLMGSLGWVLHGIFLSRLRNRHAATWESLGRPTLFWHNSVANGLAVCRFLFRGEYRALGDAEFARFARFVRAYMTVYLILLGIALIAFGVSLRARG